jgi:two-component system, NtrC family, nitrogen regulation sensor histidine kinase NtrY
LRIQSKQSFVSLFTLVLFYLFLIALILIFSQQILSSISASSIEANTFAVIVIIVLPVFLLGAIIFNLIKLIRERITKKAGSKLKTRLLLFFVFIALLSLIPQTLFSINFINSAIDFWFSARIGEAVEGGLDVSVRFYTDKVENLSTFGKSPLLEEYLDDLLYNPQKVWENIEYSNPEINILQVFDKNGNEIIYKGDSNARIEDFNNINWQDVSSPVKEVRDVDTILRIFKIHFVRNREYLVILGIHFPKRFSEYAFKLTETGRIFKQVFEYKDRFRVVLILFYFLFSFPILLLSFLISFLLSEEIIRPIVDLEEATKRVSEGDFSFRILTSTHDELSVLVSSFNKMVSELGSSRSKLIQAEKISAWKEIAQRLAHEIKNPLTPIKLSAQRIQKKYGEKSRKFNDILNNSVSAIVTEVDNLNKLLDEFREFTKLPDPFPENVNLKELIDEVLSIYRNLAVNIDFEFKYHSEEILIYVDKNQIKQVFANLLKNSIHAIADSGKIIISTNEINKSGMRFLRIQFTDTGCGMDEEIQEKLFDPYFTTKKDGSGLGLAIVERIIFDHNGTIWFETKKGSGTSFFIDLPIKDV